MMCCAKRNVKDAKVRVDAGTPNALKFAPGNPFSDAAPYDGKCSRNR